MDLLMTIATKYGIPIASPNQKIWFLRTKAGEYYHDFCTNNFIAIGWDCITPQFAQDINNNNRDEKKEIIKELYPDEKRPGLILGQIDIFYNHMKLDDIVVIPDVGSKMISIGKIGNFSKIISHKKEEDEYSVCNYVHCRDVRWIKTVKASQDVYLFKSLRAQQAISDITEDAQLLIRNLEPVYISKDSVHFTFQKISESEMNLINNIGVQQSVLDIVNVVSELYQNDEFKKNICIKTAVGSPGFLEIIMPYATPSVIVTVFLKFLIGKKAEGSNSSSTGIIALIEEVNKLVNDYRARKKVDAEIKKIEAETRLIEVQIRKTDSEATLINQQKEKMQVETDLLLLERQEKNENIWKQKNDNQQIYMTQDGKTSVQQQEELDKIVLPNENKIAEQAEKIENSKIRLVKAVENGGLLFIDNTTDRVG